MAQEEYKEETPYQIWIYPPISELDPPQETAPPPTEPVPVQQNTDEKDIALLKAKLSQKLLLLEKLHVQINTLFKEIQTDLSHQLIEIIKKTSLKIIHKELSLDASLLKEMILTAHEDHIKDEECCTLVISKEDSETLDFSDVQTAIKWKISMDESLTPGDFKLIFSSGEIGARLENRIEKLLGLQ